MAYQAIIKINEEMQKDPDDEYIEAIGQYVIDKCSSDANADLVMAEGKTLAGCLAAVESYAKTKAKHNKAVLKDSEVFEQVDRYFGFREEKKAVSLDLSDFL